MTRSKTEFYGAEEDDQRGKEYSPKWQTIHEHWNPLRVNSTRSIFRDQVTTHDGGAAGQNSERLGDIEIEGAGVLANGIVHAQVEPVFFRTA